METIWSMTKIQSIKIPPSKPALRPDPRGGDSSQNRLSVREVARRLGKSLSYVYRLDREHGPFQFIVEGRRIYIDAASFADYLANLQATGLGAVAAKAPENLAVPPAESDPVVDCAQQPVPNSTPPASGPPKFPIPRTWSGQRDLVMRPGRQAFIVDYSL